MTIWRRKTLSSWHSNIQAGQWLVAREVFFILLDRFPTHRFAPDACRWLIAFSGSSEAKRREELRQFQAPILYSFNTTTAGKSAERTPRKPLPRRKPARRS